MSTLASILYPLLTSLTVVPLYLLSRLHLDGKAAYVPVLIFLCLPNVTLMTLHLDQCLYPLLLTSTLTLFFYGYQRHRTLLESLIYIMSHRRGWPIKDPSPGLVFYIGWLDIVEYILWIGLPVARLAASCMITSWRRIYRGEARRDVLAAASLVILLLLAFVGRSFTETARLWLFLTPVLALFAAREFAFTFGRRYWMGLASLATIQMLSTFAIKLWQDFF